MACSDFVCLFVCACVSSCRVWPWGRERERERDSSSINQSFNNHEWMNECDVLFASSMRWGVIIVLVGAYKKNWTWTNQQLSSVVFPPRTCGWRILLLIWCSWEQSQNNLVSCQWDDIYIVPVTMLLVRASRADWQHRLVNHLHSMLRPCCFRKNFLIHCDFPSSKLLTLAAHECLQVGVVVSVVM